MSTITQGVALRDAGISRVRENSRSWQSRAMEILRAMPPGEYMGEDINNAIHQLIGSPHHPNAYGALIVAAIKLGVLTNTGVYCKSARPSARARRNPVYQLNNPSWKQSQSSKLES